MAMNEGGKSKKVVPVVALDITHPGKTSKKDGKGLDDKQEKGSNFLSSCQDFPCARC